MRAKHHLHIKKSIQVAIKSFITKITSFYVKDFIF